MPEICEVRKGINKKSGKPDGHLYTWLACKECGKERWVQDQSIRNPWFTGLCNKCQGIAQGKTFFRGGRFKDKNGYIYIQISSDDFFYPMAVHPSKTGSAYIVEHRLVMARHLDRCLQRWEWVHHKNGIRDDNRIENLQLVLKGSHSGEIKCPFCHKTFRIK